MNHGDREDDREGPWTWFFISWGALFGGIYLATNSGQNLWMLSLGGASVLFGLIATPTWTRAIIGRLRGEDDDYAFDKGVGWGCWTIAVLAAVVLGLYMWSRYEDGQLDLDAKDGLLIAAFAFLWAMVDQLQAKVTKLERQVRRLQERDN